MLPSSSCEATEISINPACCRICYENEKKEELITPCDCKGSIAYVHKSCLRKWLSESQTTECELCHVSFENISPPNASIRYSVVPTRFKNDIIMCTVVTPIAIIMTYVCFLSSENYSQYLSTDQWIWASVIFLLIGIILIGYWLWVYSVIRVHARLWRYSVRYLPSAASNPDCYSNNTETPNVVVEVGSTGEGHSHTNEQNARLCSDLTASAFNLNRD